jgi:hypothetical protein
MKTLYFHSASTGNKTKRVTVAGVIVDNTLRIGKAVCNPNDMFTKKKGRLISEGRANKNPLMELPFTEEENPGKIFVEQATKIVEEETRGVK